MGMKFTYQAYREFLALLKEKGYAFSNYHNWIQAPTRCVILRHDIDNSIEAALRLGRVEAAQGIRSTWFVLLRTDLYNPASRPSLAGLKELQSMGHEIGLHFDAESCEKTNGLVVPLIRREADILSDILETEITVVSIHRPSRAILEADLKIPGLVNSCGHTFFREFKYLSDSRRYWREPVLDIIGAGAYERLHILTHAFWYHETEESITDTVGGFVCSANRERYKQLAENFTDLPSILREEEL